MKTLYEKLGGTYREENGRLIPEIELPEQTNYQIGKLCKLCRRSNLYICFQARYANCH